MAPPVAHVTSPLEKTLIRLVFPDLLTRDEDLYKGRCLGLATIVRPTWISFKWVAFFYPFSFSKDTLYIRPSTTTDTPLLDLVLLARGD